MLQVKNLGTKKLNMNWVTNSGGLVPGSTLLTAALCCLGVEIVPRKQRIHLIDEETKASDVQRLACPH